MASTDRADAGSSGWVRIREGIEIRPLVSGEGTGLVLYRMEGGMEYPLHQHPHPEYGTVLLGRGTLVLENERRELNEGDSYYIPSNVPHGASLPPQPNPMVCLHVAVADSGELPRDTIDKIIREARLLLRPDDVGGTNPPPERPRLAPAPPPV